MGTTTSLTTEGRLQPSSPSVAVIVLLLAMALVGGCVKAQPPTDTGSPLSPSSASGGTATPTPTGPLAYTPDMKPIFDSDCVYCHGGSRTYGRYSMANYSAVMRDVVAGSASSRLVTTTQRGGSMYAYFSGDRATKAALVRSWVVDYKAAQTR